MKTRSLKIKGLRTILACLLALVVVVAMMQAVATNAFASSDDNSMTTMERVPIDGQDFVSIEDASYELFGDKQIRTVRHLHNFDGFPDFIYVDFEDWGYAVFKSATFELLEFSHYGSLPFPYGNYRLYYGGPLNYYVRTGSEQLFNLVTMDMVEMTAFY
jgi:hypothetical protein